LIYINFYIRIIEYLSPIRPDPAGATVSLLTGRVESILLNCKGFAMNLRTRLLTSAIISSVAVPLGAHAATIERWNTGNVEVGPAVTGTDDAASVVYDRTVPDSDAVTNGQIYYAAPEADTPGMEVLNVPYTTGQGSFDGCIIASSGATCDSDFQSGKRFKEQLTGNGPVDLVFDVVEDDRDTLYQVFQRVVNTTGQMLTDFTVELGFGTGIGFVASTAGDGLGFSPSVELGPDNKPAFTQFPFGLFGDDAQPNPNPSFTLDGFFQGDGRSGFDLVEPIGEDLLQSAGFYGDYGGLFGDWLSRDMVPEGLLWDYADGAADPLVMAWDNGSAWEVRRGIDDTLDGVIGDISANDVYALNDADWLTFDYADVDDVGAALGVALFGAPIEDLANLNLNYAISLGSNFIGENFTLRFDVNPTPVPLPAGAPLLIAGIAAFGAVRSRQKRTR